MIKLFVTRHGNAISNEKNIAASVSEKYCGGLSKIGEEQAKKLVSTLLKHKFDIIFVSPLIRTMQTVFPYLRTFTYPPKLVISELILERDLGDIKGKSMSEVKDYRESKGYNDRKRRGNLMSWTPQNGESIYDVKKRANKFIEYIKENFDGKSILVVSHSIFIRILDILLTNRKIDSFYSLDEPKHGEVKSYEIS